MHTLERYIPCAPISLMGIGDLPCSICLGKERVQPELHNATAMTMRFFGYTFPLLAPQQGLRSQSHFLHNKLFNVACRHKR